MTHNGKQAERQRRYEKRIATIQASKYSLMNNSKWAKIFRLITEYTGVVEARAKILGNEYLYSMKLEIYADTLSSSESYNTNLRGYTADGMAGPLKLAEIEYIIVTLPPNIDRETLLLIIRQNGQYEIEIQADTLIVYGWK